MPKAVLSVDFDSARNAMVEDQIKRRGIRDKVVLQALLRVPRHLFVEPGFLSRAYSDSALPIATLYRCSDDPERDVEC